MGIIRFLLKVITLPITLMLKLIVCFGSYIVEFSTGIFEFIAGVIFIVSLYTLITDGMGPIVIIFLIGGFIFAFIPSIAECLLEKLESLNEFIKDFVDDIGRNNKKTEDILQQNIQKEVKRFEIAQEKFKDVFQKSKDYVDAIGNEELSNNLTYDKFKYISLVEEYNSLLENSTYEIFFSKSKEIISKIELLTYKLIQFYEEQIKFNENVSNRSTNLDIDKSLFSGCQDKDSIVKRYRQLMKTFHPDNQSGDIEMTQKIQRTYEELIKEF